MGGGMGGRCVMYGWMAGWVGLRVGFININDMYNNDVGKGVVYDIYTTRTSRMVMRLSSLNVPQ